MLLTDSLIDQIHTFRLEMMSRSVDAIKAVHPDAAGLAIGGGYAKFAGDGSPLTQVYGLGHRGSHYDLGEVDDFYRGLATNWELIVTPFASPTLLPEAAKDGYIPDHFESVLAQVVERPLVEMTPGVEIEEAVDDLTVWMQVSDAAWSGSEELAQDLSDLARIMTAYPSRRYLASLNGEPAAIAAMVSIGDMHMFAGAATRPQFRGQGLQQALTQRRLADAREGSFVQVVALPGSQSHRNLQRVGFQPLYSKLVMYRNPIVSAA